MNECSLQQLISLFVYNLHMQFLIQQKAFKDQHVMIDTLFARETISESVNSNVLMFLSKFSLSASVVAKFNFYKLTNSLKKDSDV